MTQFLRSVNLHHHVSSVKGLGYDTTSDLLDADQGELDTIKSSMNRTIPSLSILVCIRILI